MRILLDTHVLLWHMDADTRLSERAIAQIEDASNTIYVSKASVWEIAIKISLQKLVLNTTIEGLESYLNKNSFSLIDFDYRDMQKVCELDFHHRDPFDRIIISQVINNDLTIISYDKKFRLYPVQLLQ